MEVLEIKMKCSKCGKEFSFKHVEIAEAKYSQYCLDIYDMEENCYDGHHFCDEEE